MGTNTRRAFVWRAAALAAGGSALLASAPAPTAESYSRTLGADDRIRFGLVGCGALYYYLMADSSYAFRRFNMQGVKTKGGARKSQFPASIVKRWRRGQLPEPRGRRI